MGRPKLTLQEFQKRLDRRWLGRFEALSCDGGELPAGVRCLGCGAEFSRIAQDVIIWDAGGVAYRLEGEFDRARALELAGELR